MKKFTFVLDVVTEGSLDVEAIAKSIVSNVESDGVYAAVKPVKAAALKEQGFKVWRARVAGITEESVNPKPKKVKAEKQTETAAS